MNVLFYGLEVQHRSRWGKNQCVHRDVLLSGSSRGESDSLPFIASRSCPRSLAVCPAPSSKPETAAQVLLMFHHSDLLFCLSLPFVRTLWLLWAHLECCSVCCAWLPSLAWLLRLLAYQESVGCQDCSLPGSSVYGIFQPRILTGVGCHFLF